MKLANNGSMKVKEESTGVGTSNTRRGKKTNVQNSRKLSLNQVGVEGEWKTKTYAKGELKVLERV